ncbi:hypothetical protein BGW80DRAFT_1303908 [Lactifluus volemus]|nr:hypothetical protein BGW80DRAFT_1303908 [Lactifluus volemus]
MLHLIWSKDNSSMSEDGKELKTSRFSMWKGAHPQRKAKVRRSQTQLTEG